MVTNIFGTLKTRLTITNTVSFRDKGRHVGVDCRGFRDKGRDVGEDRKWSLISLVL